MKLCANPATLAAYRAARPSVEQTLAADLDAARSDTLAAIARAVAAEHENVRLRELIGIVGTGTQAQHVIDGVEMGLTAMQARAYGILRTAEGPTRGADMARLLSTPKRRMNTDSIGKLISALRGKLSDAGSPWIIASMSGQGYRLVRASA